MSAAAEMVSKPMGEWVYSAHKVPQSHVDLRQTRLPTLSIGSKTQAYPCTPLF
jgi:hypothetical protein